MHNDNTPIARKRRWPLFHRTHRSAASWSERAPSGASSALASAPGVAEEEAGRQGAPEPEEGAAEGSRTGGDAQAPPVVDTAVVSEQPSWREPEDPPLPTPMNRRRTTEKRTVEKKIRFTPTAARAISAAANERGVRFAGFVGDAALGAARGHTRQLTSTEDDPIRPLVEALESHKAQLRYIGNNLNQITVAVHNGEVPEHATAVLSRVEQAVERSYQLLDRALTEGTADGA